MVKVEHMNANKRLVLASIFLALTIVLPMLVGGIPQVGNMLLPMHIPILLCGFICGPKYGVIIGFMAPLLKFALQGVPPLYPIGISMCFELSAYGLITGMLYRKFPRNIKYMYVNLISAMILGRVVWGSCMLMLLSIKGQIFTFSAFISGAITTAVPGIILQLIIIPFIVALVNKNSEVEVKGEAC